MRCDDAGNICLASTQYTQPGFASGQLYRSANGGANWTVVPSTQLGTWGGVWSSPDGKNWIAALANQGGQTWGKLFNSTDYGATFTPIPAPSETGVGRWEFVACDASTGRKCIAGGTNAPNGTALPPYVTTNGFQTLNTVTGVTIGTFFAAVVSADGSKMVLAQADDFGDDGSLSLPGLIYYSDDGGATFKRTNAPRGYYYSIDCDASFKMCAAAASSNVIGDPVLAVTSCDGGRTWFENPGPKQNWNAVKVNADGGMMYATTGTSTEPKYVWSFPLPTV